MTAPKPRCCDRHHYTCAPPLNQNAAHLREQMSRSPKPDPATGRHEQT